MKNTHVSLFNKNTGLPVRMLKTTYDRIVSTNHDASGYLEFLFECNDKGEKNEAIVLDRIGKTEEEISDTVLKKSINGKTEENKEKEAKPRDPRRRSGSTGTSHKGDAGA